MHICYALCGILKVRLKIVLKCCSVLESHGNGRSTKNYINVIDLKLGAILFFPPQIPSG